MKGDKYTNFYFAMALLATAIAIGIAGYMLIEGYSFIEALFMTIITISTVGYKEVAPLSTMGMWFTNFLIIFSFGIFVYAISTFARFAIEGVFRNYFRDRQINRKVKKLENHVIICGYGRNGKQAAIDLMAHRIPFIVIDNDPGVIEQIQDNDVLFIEGDSTQDEVLSRAQISRARALIATLPVDADNLFVVLTAKEMNPDLKIISRASDEHSDKKLKRAGASNVIMPDRVGGQRMAKLVIQPDIVEFVEYIMLQGPDTVAIEEVSCENLAGCFDGKTIRELDLRNESGANIIGLRKKDKTYVINPSPDETLTRDVKIFALGNATQIKRLKALITIGKVNE